MPARKTVPMGPPAGFQPEAGRPPFVDLLPPPADEPFDRLSVPAAPAPRASAGERWNRLSARRQGQALAAGIALFGGGVMLWPAASAPAFTPFVPAAPQPPTAIPEPKEPVVVKPDLKKFQVAVKPVPLNTLLTDAALAEYFRPFEAVTVPAGAVDDLGTARGRYLVQAVADGQVLTAALLADRPLELPKPPEVAPPLPPPAPMPLRTWQATVTTGSGQRVYTWQEWADRGVVLAADEFVPAVPPTRGKP